MSDALHLTREQLEAGLGQIQQSPRDNGVLELIVCRPQTDVRDVLPEGKLDLIEGLVGDSWKSRGSTKTPDGSANPEMQITLMNSRAVALLARDQSRWPLAGDQLFVDLNLSTENLPPGTRLTVGSAIVEVTAPPHTGCKKFVSRFGMDAMQFVNSPIGRQLNLRGVHARVIKPGTIRAGDSVKKA